MQTPIQAPNPFANPATLRVLVTGATGFIGSALVAQLVDAGHQVTAWTRSVERARAKLGAQVACVERLSDLAHR